MFVFELYNFFKDYIFRDIYIGIVNKNFVKLDDLDNIKEMMGQVILFFIKYFNDIFNSRFFEYYLGQFVIIFFRFGRIVESYEYCF